MKEDKTESATKVNAPGPGRGRVRLGGFGKHPAWNDFPDTHLGHETEFMAQAEKQFFLGTIRKLVDSKQWDADDDGKEWCWLWQKGNDFLLGLLWPSQDGTLRGRKFPMWLCVHAEGLDVFWALEHLLPVLSLAAKRIRELKAKEEVLKCVEDVQAHCGELAAKAGQNPVTNYLSRAGQLTKETWLSGNPDALPRALYFIQTRLASVAIAAKDLKRSKTEEFEALRLPVPAEESCGCLGAWMSFLRTQIDNDAPILLVRSSGSGWCDAFFGGIYPDSELSRNNTLRLKQGLEGIPLVTEIPYPLDENFRLQARQTLDTLGADWGASGKRSIFGPVPGNYRAELPAVKPVKNPGTALGAIQLKKLVSTFTKPEASQSTPTSPIRGGKLKWMAISAGGVLTAGLIILLVSLFRPSSEQPPKKTNSLSSDDQQQITGDWHQYVGDYEHWLKPLAAEGGTWTFTSPYLQTNLSNIIAGVGSRKFDPLAIYGSTDTRNLGEPDWKVVSKKQAELRRAYKARDQIKALLQDEYRAKVAADVEALAKTPLAAATRGALPPADTNSAPAAIVSQAISLESVEKSASALTADWAKWQSLRGALTEFDTNAMAHFLAEQEQSLAAATTIESASGKLAEACLMDEAVLDWLRASWNSLDQAGLRKELAHNPVASLVAWTNLAADYTKIFIDTDPRLDFRAQVQEEIKKHVNDVVEEAKGGNPTALLAVTELTNKLDRIQSELADLTNTVAIRRNEASLNAKMKDLQGEIHSFIRVAAGDWERAINFNTLMNQQAAIDYGNANVNRLWQGYLKQVEGAARGQTQPLTRDALLEWHGKLQKAGLFLTNLAGVHTQTITSPLFNDPALSQQPKVSGFARDALTDYTASIFRQNVGADLGMLRTFDEFSSSLAKAVLDQKATNFTATAAALIRDESRFARGAIPRDLNDFRNECSVIADTDIFPTASQSPIIQELLHMNAAIASTPADANAIANGLIRNPPADFLRLAMLLGRLNEFSAWPDGPAGWKTVAGVAQASQKLAAGGSSGPDPDAARNALREWVDWQWTKASPRITTFSQINECLAVPGGLGQIELPKNLIYNSKFATLIDSFSETDTGGFKKRARDFINDSAAAAAGPVFESDKAILGKILLVPNTGTDENGLAPKRLGLGVRFLADERVEVVRENATNIFKLMNVAGISPVYVSTSEFSCDAFISLANQNASIQFQWLNDLQKALGDVGGATVLFYDHLFNYLNNLMPSVNGVKLVGLRLRRSRMEIGGKTLAEAPILQRYSVVTDDMPANFVSPDLASKVSAAWGCRLLTPGEWAAIDKTLPPSSNANLDTAAVKEVYRELEQRAGTGASKTLAKLFSTTVLASSASDPSPADTGSMMFEVDDPHPRFQQKGLIHWRGNVAEFLKDGSQYFVAGGSFASGQGANPNPQPLPQNEPNRGYADAGFRLAFDWAGTRPADTIRAFLADLKPVPCR
jgi:hypothetical protein